MKSLTMLCVVCLLAGCATLRQVPVDVSEEEIENVKALRIAARNWMSVAEFQIGMVEGGLGEDINKLPASTVAAIKEYKQLAALDPNTLTDEQLGISLGLRLRILCAVVKEALAIYAPKLLLYLI